MQGVSTRILGNLARHSRTIALRQRLIPSTSRGHFVKPIRPQSTAGTPNSGSTAPKAKTPESSSSASSAASSTPKATEQTIKAADKAAATGAAQASAKEGTATQPLPDVHSTSLGIEDPDANDPLKWKKFAWKYAGAVFVFLIAYKSVNWYVDKLEAEGKRKREEIEENKELKKEFEADREKAQVMLATAQGRTPPGSASGDAQGAVLPQLGQPQPLSLFKTIQEEDGYVSELDELRALQVELEAKLKALKRERKQTDEIMNKKWEIEGELKDLEREVADLEKMEERRKKG